MSTYYNYDFVSPDPIYALVQEELRSYFSTGSVDPILFPLWTRKCLKKLSRGMNDITHTVLRLCDFQAKLPPDYIAVREAWVCAQGYTQYRLPSATYQSVITDIAPSYTSFTATDAEKCISTKCVTDVQVVYKTITDSFVENYKISHLLRPGNIATKRNCNFTCLNNYSSSLETYDIHGDKFITNFREGDVYLIYYASKSDCQGNPMVPDNVRIQEYIEAYLKYKIFEMLSNQITDETFNQIENKKMYYKQLSDEAFIIADIETKKQTIYQKFMAIKRDMNRLSMFNID